MNARNADWYDCLKEKYPIITEEEWITLDRITKSKVIKKGKAF